MVELMFDMYTRYTLYSVPFFSLSMYLCIRIFNTRWYLSKFFKSFILLYTPPEWKRNSDPEFQGRSISSSKRTFGETAIGGKVLQRFVVKLNIILYHFYHVDDDDYDDDDEKRERKRMSEFDIMWKLSIEIVCTVPIHYGYFEFDFPIFEERLTHHSEK